MGGLSRSAVVLLLASNVALPLGAADLSSLAPGARATIAYPEFGAPLVGGVASVTIGLPANFDRDKSYGIYLWYNGGGGGAGTDDTFSFPDRQICLSLPLFRRSASDPSPPDLAHETAKDPAGLHLEQVDWYKNWIALEAVLADLHRVAPHIDPELSYCGGYSNGGHLVGFMAAHSAAFCSQFKGYLFVEGGYDGFKELSTVKFLTGSDRAIYAVGGEKSSANDIRAGIYDACVAARIDATFLFEPGVGHAYDQKYKPDTRAWIEAHIFNPGLAEALHALDGALAHKRYGDAVRAYRAACGANHAVCAQDKTLADDLAKLEAVAAPALATLDLGTASANQLRHALAQWAPCPATAPLEARLDQLAEQALAKLPVSTGKAAESNLRRFIKEWSATTAASAAVANLDAFAQAGLQAAQALPPGPKRVAALLAVARAWKDVPTGAKADQAAQDEASQLLHDAQAITDLRARGQKEVIIARLMPATVIGELAMDDALLLSRQLAN